MGGASQSADPVILRAGSRSREKLPSAKAPAFAIRAAFLWQLELKEVRAKETRSSEPLLEAAFLLCVTEGQLLRPAHARQPTRPPFPPLYLATNRQVEPKLSQLGVKGRK